MANLKLKLKYMDFWVDPKKIIAWSLSHNLNTNKKTDVLVFIGTSHFRFECDNYTDALKIFNTIVKAKTPLWKKLLSYFR